MDQGADLNLLCPKVHLPKRLARDTGPGHCHVMSVKSGEDKPALSQYTSGFPHRLQKIAGLSSPGVGGHGSTGFLNLIIYGP